MMGKLFKGYKEWYETEDNKNYWDSWEWEIHTDEGIANPDYGYELVEVIDTDKHDHPTEAWFRKYEVVWCTYCKIEMSVSSDYIETHSTGTFYYCPQCGGLMKEDLTPTKND